MENYKRGLVIFVIVVAGLAILTNFNLTGLVVWEPVSNNNCSDVQIGIIWNSVFVVDGFNIEILKGYESCGNCEKYIAYKNNSDGELWVLLGENYNLTSWGGDFRYFDNGRILNRFNLSFAYLNATSSFIELFNGESGIDSKMNVLENVNEQDITNWSVPDSSALVNKFNYLYGLGDLSGENFSDNGDYFDFDEIISNDMNFSNFGVAIFKNESISRGEYSVVVYDSDFVIDFMSSIPDYDFDVNSSWVFAFNLSDYFNVSDDVSISFNYTGTGNTNGELINYSINESGVFFMPTVNFNGSCEFQFVANNPAGDNIYSNYFDVAIVIPNNEPVLIKNFENINISQGGNVSVVLSDYFEDVDNDSLSYSAVKTDGINFSFGENSVSIWLNNNFSVYAKLRVYASDGIESVVGNWFYIYENIQNENLVAENGAENESVNASVDDAVVFSENENVSSGVGDSADDKELVKWIFLSIAIIVILAGIMFIIWFFVLRKNGRSNT